jgi:polar amino acid transport system substrate-binding protein
MTGSRSELVAKSRFSEAQIIDFESSIDAIASLKANHLDAVITDYPTAYNVSRHNADLTFFPDTLAKEMDVVAVKKGNKELLAVIDSVIIQLHKDGTLKDMKKRWFKFDLSAYDDTDVNTPSSGNVVKIGTVSNKEPFCFIGNNQKLTGHDIELAHRIAAGLNRPIELLDMKFAALIPALQSGKIDMIVAGMLPTDERRKKVDFSQSYFENFIAMVVKKPVDSRADNKKVESIDSLKNKNNAADTTTFWQGLKNSFYNNIILEKRYLLILRGLRTTALIFVFAALIGTLLGALVCFLKLSPIKVVNQFAQFYISILRGTPIVVLLMLIFYVVFGSVNINPVIVAIVAFSLNFSAYASEIFRSGIQGVDNGQYEAGIALGFTKVKTFVYIIIPQAAKLIFPVFKGELITLVKMTSIVGYIGVADLTKASDIIRSRTFDAFFPLIMIALMYFLISWILLILLGYIEQKMDSKLQKRKV